MQESLSIRETFVSKFSVLLSNELGNDMARLVTPLLSEFISDYEIDSRQTEIVLYDDLIPKWLQEYLVAKVVAGCKDNSIRDYAVHLKHFFEALHRPCGEITESDIQKYIGWCLRVQNNSKSYVDHKRAVINDFYKWSVQKGYVSNNPCAGIAPMKSPRTTRVPYTADELSKIRNEVSNARDKAIIETFISTACRVEELCRLNIDDIDFVNNTVALFGKGDKHRISYMNAEMKHAVTQYINSRSDNNPALFVGRRRDSRTGNFERVTTHGVETVTRRLSKAIGVANIQPHRFRRTTATNMSNSGCSISDVQRFLGHSSPSTTAIYIYNDQENLKMLHKKFVH